MDLKGKKINFLGDSITEGHGTSGEKAWFCTKIAENYGAVCRNYGIGGTRIAKQRVPDICPEWDRDFIDRVDIMDPDADIVVVFGGTNDFGHGDAPIGRMSDRSPYTFYGALHTLYTKLIEKYPSSRILVLTPLHRVQEDSLRGDGRKPYDVGTLYDYVAVIREVAEYYSLPVLDMFKVSGLQPKVDIIKEKYVPDGLHPNDDGHTVLAEIIGKALENL